MKIAFNITPPPASKSLTRTTRAGFTLIELSIVLIIIGLIAAGILVGQDLVSGAAVRAQISQIEKLDSAANTFYGKYGYLPGDIPEPYASRYGFQPRGIYPGEGDGNGVIQGHYTNNKAYGDQETVGETVAFWVDLSTSSLIDGTFSKGSVSIDNRAISAINVPLYFPAAKVGNGNFIYAWSGAGSNPNDGANYFGLSAVTGAGLLSCNGCIDSSPGITEQQAYSIDKKMDDGLPLSGNVRTMYLNDGNGGIWPSGQNVYGVPNTGASSGSSTTCYDNGGNAANPMQYSLAQNNGTGINCALSFKMQAGD